MIGLLLLACSAPSPQYPELAQALMSRSDLNGDGRVDAGEYALLSRADEPMGGCDTDGDQALDALELEACFLSVSPTRLQAERRRSWMEARGEGTREPGKPGKSGKRGRR